MEDTKHKYPIRDSILKLADRGNITLQEWKELRMNSWEREFLIPHLTSTALVHSCKDMLKHCTATPFHTPASTYDESVMKNYIPALLRMVEKTSEDVRYFSYVTRMGLGACDSLDNPKANIDRFEKLKELLEITP